MKIICNKYLICNNKECPHKKPHDYMKFCDTDCERVHNSTCHPSLKIIREDKLKKLGNMKNE